MVVNKIRGTPVSYTHLDVYKRQVRDRITVPAGSSDEEVTEKALSAERVMKMIGEGEKARSRVKNVIVVKDKLVNIVV